MRVLFATPYFAPAFAFGGIPRATWELARALASRGATIHVLTSDAYTLTRGWPGPLNEWEDLHGVNVMRVAGLNADFTERLGLFVPFHSPASLKRSMPPIDVVHIHGHRHLLGHLAAWLTEYRRPLVLTPHGSAGVIESKHGLKRVYDTLTGDRMVRNAAATIAVAHAEEPVIRARGGNPAHLHVVPNCVDMTPTETRVERGNFRARYGIGDEPLILFLHKITPRKNLDVLLQACRMLVRDGIPFTLAIGGAALLGMQPYTAMIDDLGLASRVVMTGHLDGQPKWEALTDADVLAYPADTEVFGLTAFESLLCGTPVVAADDDGMAEWLQVTGGARFCPPRNAAALAATLRAVLTRAPLPEHEIRTAAAIIRERFHPHRVADETLRIYEAATLR